MDLFVPCTIDLQKHQSSDNKYGLEHINKLLEDELSQLRSLKSEKPKELFLPTVKSTNKKNTEVEGFEDYQRRVEHVRSRDPKSGIEEQPLRNMPSTIAPFSERSNDFPKDDRILGKGQMPFFQLSSDGHSLSCRFPRLLETRSGKTSSHCLKGLLDDAVCDEQRLCSKRSERGKQLSGKLVRSSFGVKHDPTSDYSDHEELGNNLRIQNCNMTLRQDSFIQDVKGRTQNSLSRNNRHYKKTFHLACTRDPRKYKTTDRNERDCTFCAGPVFLHSRGIQNGDGKSQRMRDRKAQTVEKTSLPRLGKSSTEKTKTVRHSCERCKKRLEQAEVNRIAIATAGSSRKQTEVKNTDVERKAKSRPVTKEKVLVETPLPADKKENILPLLEYTAYMDQDGSLFLLPGSFTLRKKDYNIWSRCKKSSEEKSFRSQTILTGTKLPYLAR